MVPFRELKNRHAGETILVAGTGPSLDRLVDAAITGPRIYLNRSAFVLPASAGKTYWLVADDAWGKKVPGPWFAHLRAVQDGSAKTVLCVRSPLLGAGGFPPAPIGPNIFHWKSEAANRDRLLSLSRDEIADLGELWMFSGTGGTAVHLAWYLGASKLVLAGLDGADGYAKRLRHLYNENKKGGNGYSFANECARKAIAALGLEIEIV